MADTVSSCFALKSKRQAASPGRERLPAFCQNVVRCPLAGCKLLRLTSGVWVPCTTCFRPLAGCKLLRQSCTVKVAKSPANWLDYTISRPRLSTTSMLFAHFLQNPGQNFGAAQVRSPSFGLAETAAFSPVRTTGPGTVRACLPAMRKGLVLVQPTGANHLALLVHNAPAYGKQPGSVQPHRLTRRNIRN